MSSYKGKWAVVTGASTGIGTQIALKLAKKGMNLVIIARREALLNQVKIEIEALGQECKVLVLDLAEISSTQKLKSWLVSEEIIPYVVVNNAGVGLYGAFMTSSHEEMSRMLILNVNTLTSISREIGEMIPDGGHLMQVASTICYIPVPMYSVYAATKSYVHTFAYALAYELSPRISVTTLYPGMTDTEFFDTSHHRVASWLKKIMMYPADYVAQKGVEGMFKRRSRVIAGVLNKFMAVLSLVTPDWMNRAMLYHLFRIAGGSS